MKEDEIDRLFASELPLDGSAQELVRGLVAEAIKRWIYMCVPPKTYGQVRLGPATHLRFLATIWVVCPEVFDGKTQIEMSEMLGVSRLAFIKACSHARTAIEARKRS